MNNKDIEGLGIMWMIVGCVGWSGAIDGYLGHIYAGGITLGGLLIVLLAR